MRSSLIVLILGLFLWATASGKAIGAEDHPLSGRIIGTVIDRDAGTTLPGAHIIIEGTSIGTATNDKGAYIIPNAPAGRYTLVVSYIGYQQQRRAVDVVDGETILHVYAEVGTMLGRALSLSVDLLNLERIVVGSIFVRGEALIRPAMERVMQEECLPEALQVCSVHAAVLGERISDVAALTLAQNAMERNA